LQPGENPDVEIGRYLTETASFSRIPLFQGEITVTPAQGEKMTVASLQQFVENEGSGWEWFIRQLTEFYVHAAALPAPAPAPNPEFNGTPEPLPESMESARRSLDAAALLGRLTAEMHVVLGRPTEMQAFAPELFTVNDLERDARRIENQLAETLKTMKATLGAFDDATSDLAGLFLSRRPEFVERIRSISRQEAAGQRIRIHGDYHLGQTLRTSSANASADSGQGTDSGDFILLDFEGEPARSLTERREKQSPLKDVAGMLRSFSYVAHAALDQFRAANHEYADSAHESNLAAWSVEWQKRAFSEFQSAYRQSIAANPLLLPPPQQCQALCDAYMLEKALYELRYELNNRPAWVRIPIDGILRL
jgi:maltose alpha-D-glucosyltransferase/alpha-amylase